MTDYSITPSIKLFSWYTPQQDGGYRSLGRKVTSQKVTGQKVQHIGCSMAWRDCARKLSRVGQCQGARSK